MSSLKGRGSKEALLQRAVGVPDIFLHLLEASHLAKTFVSRVMPCSCARGHPVSMTPALNLACNALSLVASRPLWMSAPFLSLSRLELHCNLLQWALFSEAL